MADANRPRILRTHTGLRLSRSIERRGILFLTEHDEDEIRIEEIDPKSGRWSNGANSRGRPTQTRRR